MNIRLHLAYRHTERFGNLLIARLLEVEEHEWYSLVIWKLAKRPLQAIPQFRLLQSST